MQRSLGQTGFADALVAGVVKPNERLERIDRLVEWDKLERLLAPLRSAPTGRPGYRVLMMLKALLLQQWYGLSDEELEAALADRISFRRFLGLSLADATPDHSTIWRFREALKDGELAEPIFAELQRQFDARGLLLRHGTLIDATLVEAAVRPSGSAAAPSDPDAAFARRQGKAGATFGFKAHVAADQGSGLVRAAILTPANVNETTVADALIRGDERAVYADMAYATKARRAALKARGIKDRIMRRPNKHHPVLNPRLARRNRLIAAVRGRVETIFGVLKRHYDWTRARYLGLARNQTHLHLLCMAINLRRACVIAT
jgi:transposase, IS5 family